MHAETSRWRACVAGPGRSRRSLCRSRFSSTRPTSFFSSTHSTGLGLSRGTDADQGRAEDLRMLVENRLAGNGVERLVFRDHAMRLAAAEPKSALLVEIADVTHAVPEAVAVRDFRQGRLFRAMKIGACDDRAADDDFTDFARTAATARRTRRNRSSLMRMMRTVIRPPVGRRDAGALGGVRGVCRSGFRSLPMLQTGSASVAP